MIPWLIATDDNQPFPALETALEEPNGLLAAGGSLRPARLLNAYRAGVFPWFSGDQPILWWSPNPRLVLKPSELHLSKSFQKFLRKKMFHCTFDHSFLDVIRACAGPRVIGANEEEPGTWITDSMQESYLELHKMGYAHSVEVWDEKTLVGGLYGLSIGRFFFGESMFSLKTNASKTGFAFLCQQLQDWGYQYIDCQVETDHLISLGAYEIHREYFKQLLDENCDYPPEEKAWELPV